MIDQALHIQSLYVIWKTHSLTAAADPSPEEIRSRDKLKERRDMLIEKLLEFTIGTQSNTTDAVRRAVSSVRRRNNTFTKLLFILGVPKSHEPSYSLLSHSVYCSGWP